MSNAIGLKFVPYDEKKHIRNHFLGPAVLPEFLADEFDDDVMFLGMVHLPDIAELDEENHLPHIGYLYFFLDTSRTNRQLGPIVIYSEEEPTICFDDFNNTIAAGECPGADIPHGVEFEKVPGNAEGCKLLGVPCDWAYEKAPKEPLLLQISHFDEELDFLPQLDGFTYIFFGPKGKRFEGATAFHEYA